MAKFLWYNPYVMKDSLTIKNLELWTRIGIPAEERAKEQRLLIDLTLHTTAPDEGAISIDYEKVAEDIRALGKSERLTIEKLATDIADAILKKYSPASLMVTVTKFPLPGTQHVSLTISRP